MRIDSHANNRQICLSFCQINPLKPLVYFTNLVSRIELDLRIADSESALAHYQSVQNREILSKFFDFLD